MGRQDGMPLALELDGEEPIAELPSEGVESSAGGRIRTVSQPEHLAG